MLFVVMFEDLPTAFGIRQREMQAHLDYLREQAGNVLVAGSLRESPELQPLGGCWIVKAASRDAVDTLVKADPFYRHGLRAHYRVLHWSKAFDEPATV
jgi:hypothetical protein